MWGDRQSLRKRDGESGGDVQLGQRFSVFLLLLVESQILVRQLLIYSHVF
jgi:hypothetical protein